MSGATDAVEAAREIQERRPDFAPAWAIVLGSGLGPLADRIEDPTHIPYADLPGFPALDVEGHTGELILGMLGGAKVVCLAGRKHAYEGRIDAMKVPVRTCRLIGAEAIYLTCAAGSLRTEVGPGSLMTITDHINLMGGSPLVGPNDEDFGPRFPPMEEAWDPALIQAQRDAAAALGVNLAAGTYAAWLGPAFETPAEVRMIQALGGDAVGMSTVPECLVARHCGLRVTGTAVITNLGVGLSDQPVNHDQTLKFAAQASETLQGLVERVVGGG